VGNHIILLLRDSTLSANIIRVGGLASQVRRRLRKKKSGDNFAMKGYEGFSPKNFKRIREHIAPVKPLSEKSIEKKELKKI
jgi:hypothetical protein